ncbi:hypothetical protein C8R45DRAFT_1044462 [Mycena sanguinolenta]|nr:hypothetical protein C8R45DRAFT_1044462 [Mycena sanguinolenta]
MIIEIFDPCSHVDSQGTLSAKFGPLCELPHSDLHQFRPILASPCRRVLGYSGPLRRRPTPQVRRNARSCPCRVVALNHNNLTVDSFTPPEPCNCENMHVECVRFLYNSKASNAFLRAAPSPACRTLPLVSSLAPGFLAAEDLVSRGINIVKAPLHRGFKRPNRDELCPPRNLLYFACYHLCGSGALHHPRQRNAFLGHERGHDDYCDPARTRNRAY